MLGHDRLNEMAVPISRSPLSSRSVQFGYLAAIVAGTMALGAIWWSRQGRRGGRPGDWVTHDHGMNRIAHDVADRMWGEPAVEIEEVEFLQPPEVMIQAGPEADRPDVIVVAYSSGQRVDAQFVGLAQDGKGRRYRIDFATERYSSPRLCSIAWPVAASAGPHRLPFEIPASPHDPYERSVDQRATNRLIQYALDHGAPAETIHKSWRTAGDAVECLAGLEALGQPQLLADTTWMTAMRNLVDGDAEGLANALSLVWHL